MDFFRKEWRGLGVQEKLHILIQGTLIILFFILMEWILDRFEVQIEKGAEARAEQVADGLINGLNMLMLTGQISNPETRKLYLSKMAQSQGILELRIIRGQAVIDQFGPGLPEEMAKDELDREVLGTGRTIFQKINDSGDKPALRVVVPFIANANFRGTNCLACHSTKPGGVNGAASVIVDLTDEEAMLREIDNWLWIGHVVLQLLLLVFISLIVYFVIVRNITKPVKKLQLAMSDIQRSNDLSKRADVDIYNPDIGEMARSFNVLLEGLEKANQRLKLFAKMFDNSGEAIIITDADRNILTVNPAFVSITGYTQDEVIGKNPKVLSSGRQSEEFYRLMWNALNEKGQWQGEIWNRRKNGEIYPEWLSIGVVRNAKGQVINYISLFQDITKRKEAEARIEFLAHYDSLTKLPNRALFADRLRRAVMLANRNKTKIGLLFLDLDKFKTINDTMGHAAGDELLESVADRLRSCVRESDTICRQGGDEFLVLLENVEGNDDVDTVAHKIIEAMSRPHLVGGQSLSVTFSIGAAIYPDDAEDDETLIKHADEAMYLAKEKGRNNFQYYRKPD